MTMALMDLRNAFGDVHHKLIAEALEFHQVPVWLIQIFQTMYENCIAVSLNKELSQPIRVERGVLQGDPSSPLLFNICFNTLMSTPDQPIYRKLGF